MQVALGFGRAIVFNLPWPPSARWQWGKFEIVPLARRRAAEIHAVPKASEIDLDHNVGAWPVDRCINHDLANYIAHRPIFPGLIFAFWFWGKE